MVVGAAPGDHARTGPSQRWLVVLMRVFEGYFSSPPRLRFRVLMLPSFNRGTAEATAVSGDTLSTCAEPAFTHLRSSDRSPGREGGVLPVL